MTVFAFMNITAFFEAKPLRIQLLSIYNFSSCVLYFQMYFCRFLGNINLNCFSLNACYDSHLASAMLKPMYRNLFS